MGQIYQRNPAAPTTLARSSPVLDQGTAPDTQRTQHLLLEVLNTRRLPGAPQLHSRSTATTTPVATTASAGDRARLRRSPSVGSRSFRSAPGLVRAFQPRVARVGRQSVREPAIVQAVNWALHVGDIVTANSPTRSGIIPAAHTGAAPSIVHSMSHPAGDQAHAAARIWFTAIATPAAAACAGQPARTHLISSRLPRVQVRLQLATGSQLATTHQLASAFHSDRPRQGRLPLGPHRLHISPPPEYPPRRTSSVASIAVNRRSISSKTDRPSSGRAAAPVLLWTLFSHVGCPFECRVHEHHVLRGPRQPPTPRKNLVHGSSRPGRPPPQPPDRPT